MVGLMVLLLLGIRSTPIELGDKIVAPLATLQGRGEADESHEDEEKLRAYSPAIFDHACILKYKYSPPKLTFFPPPPIHKYSPITHFFAFAVFYFFI
jgi:hypothetical protein